MANQQTSDNYSGKLPNFVPFFNFVGLIQQNSKLSTTLQALGKEWTEFVQARLREDTQLLQTLGECREFPSMQRVYMQFWEKALSQYEEETQRLMRITQGAVEDATHSAQGAVEDATHIAQEAQERIEATNGNADGRGASSSSSPSATKRASPSRRDSA
jgi:Phasin protein